MDSDRSHRRTNSSDLFICLTSRLSSSSSMKSILSPARSRESSQICLSSSVSRRLKSNGSIKGAQSPMFPKKRGSGFENLEPSSPKVTCIGQVRVKTKKQGNKMRTRSMRRGAAGEVSFRRVVEQNKNGGTNQDFNSAESLPHRNQRWVHLPVTICEALRTFGAEFNCFVPCRSTCTESDKGKDVVRSGGGSGEEVSCGTVIARWFVAVHEGEGGKGSKTEIVVEEREEIGATKMRSSRRRHVFENIEKSNEEFEEEVEEDRVSICVPPKNALLLMRCRSDPVKMAALANKLWEAHDIAVEEEEEEDEVANGTQVEESGAEDEEKRGEKEEQEKVEVEIDCKDLRFVEENENPDLETDFSLTEDEGEDEDEHVEANAEKEEPDSVDKRGAKENSADLEKCKDEDTVSILLQESEDFTDLENVSNLVEGNEFGVIETGIHDEVSVDSIDETDNPSSISTASMLESVLAEEQEEGEEQETVKLDVEETTGETCEEEGEEILTHIRSEPEVPYPETVEKEEDGEQTASLLPKCLLLMMCEPKLSMEVSKETWVCSKDFIRCLPSNPRRVTKVKCGEDPKTKLSKISSIDAVKLKLNKADGGASDDIKRMISIEYSNPTVQPSRSSCSYPSSAATANGTDGVVATAKKMVGGKVFEPLVLARCKSEPRRSAAKLAPEACFWNNRKLEPHHTNRLEACGATGVGF